MNRRAFTLLELIIVVAIIMLLASLLFPVFAKAKAEAHASTCAQQLHQIGLAFTMYRDDRGGVPREWGFDGLVDGGYLKDGRLLVCPMDTYSGYSTDYHKCDFNKLMADRTSYLTPFGPLTFYWDAIFKVDPNAGIAVCRSHGSPPPEYADKINRSFCNESEFYFEGKTLRLRLDGSVQLFQYAFDRERDKDGQVHLLYSFRKLFTDIPSTSTN